VARKITGLPCHVDAGLSLSKEEERVPFNRNSSLKIVAPAFQKISVNWGVKEGMNAV
jgi:hypothetical protein